MKNISTVQTDAEAIVKALQVIFLNKIVQVISFLTSDEHSILFHFKLIQRRVDHRKKVDLRVISGNHLLGYIMS